MIRTRVQCRRSSSRNWRSLAVFLSICILPSTAVLAGDAGQARNPAFSVAATHLMGFASAPKNANGTLSVEADAIQFQKSGKAAVQVNIASVQNVFLGDQSREVGGVPMTLGKAAVPFGGGRAVSLFAHKKYDTVTLEYVDVDGGLHGAIFELKKGQGELFRKELVARGARLSDEQGASTNQNAEVSNEKE